MSSVVSTSLNLSVGQPFSCKYPKHGKRNILANRKGVIEKHGNGPSGEFVVVKLDNGSYRTFSTSRMVDAVNA